MFASQMNGGAVQLLVAISTCCMIALKTPMDPNAHVASCAQAFCNGAQAVVAARARASIGVCCCDFVRDIGWVYFSGGRK